MEPGKHIRDRRFDQMPWQALHGLLHGQGQGHEGFSFQSRRDDQAGIQRWNLFHTQYQDKGWPVGHEAQINQTQKDPVKTGSVYIVKKNLKAPAKDNEWFHYEIIVKGKRVETKVDGKTVVVYEEGKGVKGRGSYQRVRSVCKPMTQSSTFW